MAAIPALRPQYANTTEDWGQLSASLGGILSDEPVSTVGSTNAKDYISPKYRVTFNSEIDGQKVYMEVSWDPAAKRWVVENPGSVAKYIATTNATTAKATLSPEDQQLLDLEIQQRQANLAKSQRDLATPTAQQQGSMQGAYEDLDATIEYIRNQWSTGQITAAEANKRMAQARQAFSDTISGSSAAKRASDAAGYRQTNAQIGAGMLNQRVSSGTGLANQLLSGADERFGKIYAGTGPDSMYNFNPFELAKKFTTELGGGEQAYNTAGQMVIGATAQGGADPSTPDYWLGSPNNPGDPGAPDDAGVEATDPMGRPWYPPSTPYGPDYPRSQTWPGG